MTRPSGIGKSLDYDSERGSDLSLTLSTYLETSQHHANTLYNRLERINELIGPGWKEIPHGIWTSSWRCAWTG